MVRGLRTFASHLEGLEKSYILIGGTACDLWLGQSGLTFRATKDLDVVLVTESIGSVFVRRFWGFIESGEYSARSKSSHSPPYYRFEKPGTDDYPAKIELFSNDLLGLPDDARLTPIPASDELRSLSAILLDGPSYRFVLESRIMIDGIPTVPAATLIPLKAAAWRDLADRKKAGEQVDSRDIRKHRNDVFRLYVTLAPADRYDVPVSLKVHLEELLLRLPPDSDDWNAIRTSIEPLELPTPSDVRQTISEVFELGQTSSERIK